MDGQISLGSLLSILSSLTLEGGLLGHRVALVVRLGGTAIPSSTAAALFHVSTITQRLPRPTPANTRYYLS